MVYNCLNHGKQYQEYVAKSNDILYSCSETFEYKYAEVSLDLRFFPYKSSSDLPVYHKTFTIKVCQKWRKLCTSILKKLLIFRLDGLNSDEVSYKE